MNVGELMLKMATKIKLELNWGAFDNTCDSQMLYRLPLLNLPSTYSDRVVEIAKLDEHCLCLKPLKRVQKDRISTVTLNSVDDHYSLVIGFESGDIQLLQEQSGYQCLQGTRHNDSVLSLSLSGQVWHQLLFYR